MLFGLLAACSEKFAMDHRVTVPVVAVFLYGNGVSVLRSNLKVF